MPALVIWGKADLFLPWRFAEQQRETFPDARIALLPVIAGLSYELIRFAARKRGSLLALLTAPGLWLQKITTQPPSDGQVEVAITALDGAMVLEKKQGGQLVIA